VGIQGKKIIAAKCFRLLESVRQIRVGASVIQLISSLCLTRYAEVTFRFHGAVFVRKAELQFVHVFLLC
jgi:hypothetical protein